MVRNSRQPEFDDERGKEHNTGMPEETAIQYVGQPEENLRLIAYGITIAGAVAAATKGECLQWGKNDGATAAVVP